MDFSSLQGWSGGVVLRLPSGFKTNDVDRFSCRGRPPASENT